MVTLNGMVVLPDGSTLNATRNVPVAARTMFGVDPSESSTTDHAQDIAWFPGARVGAAYAGAGQGLPAWTSGYVTQMLAAGYRVTFSAKDLVVAAFTAQWSAMPAPRPGHGVDAHDYTIFAECNRPSGGPALASWRSCMGSLIAARNSHPNRDRIKLGPVFSWWPAQVGNNEAVAWRQFMMPGMDFAGWDMYYANGIGVYADPDRFTALPALSAADYGVDIAVREFGVNGSQTDATAAAFVKAVVPVFQAKRFQSVSYFNYTQGTSSARITPTGRPLTFAAWKAACADQ